MDDDWDDYSDQLDILGSVREKGDVPLGQVLVDAERLKRLEAVARAVLWDETPDEAVFTWNRLLDSRDVDEEIEAMRYEIKRRVRAAIAALEEGDVP